MNRQWGVDLLKGFDLQASTPPDTRMFLVRVAAPTGDQGLSGMRVDLITQIGTTNNLACLSRITTSTAEFGACFVLPNFPGENGPFRLKRLKGEDPVVTWTIERLE